MILVVASLLCSPCKCFLWFHIHCWRHLVPYMPFLCSWHMLHHILHLFKCEKLHIFFMVRCSSSLILQFHFVNSLADPISFANFESPCKTCFLLHSLLFLTKFFKFKLLPQLSHLFFYFWKKSLNDKLSKRETKQLPFTLSYLFSRNNKI